jgi:hypothetical protein
MKRCAILLGFLLAPGGGVSGAGDAAADPLAGKTFRSLEKLPGGERRDGVIVPIHWEIRFKDKSFAWRHTDVISTGTYAFDAATGTVTVKGGLKASFNAKTGVLTWDKHQYKAVPSAK